MKDKKKRLLIVAGGGILALALILAIAGQFHTDTPAEDVLSSSGATDSGISSAPEVNISEQNESAVSVQPEDTESEAAADLQSGRYGKGNGDGIFEKHSAGRSSRI